ncbi:MAG: MBL fold metallo-hydrolase [Candidatus Hydrogenedentota bacterium]
MGDEIVLSQGLLRVKIIKTDAGYIRIGSFPDILKRLRKTNIQPYIIILAPFKTGDFGDKRLGEEFIFWDSIFFKKQRLRYIAPREILKKFYDILNCTVPWDLDDERIKIIRREWLDETFIPCEIPWDQEKVLENLFIYYSREGVEIRDSRGRYFVKWNELIETRKRERPLLDIKFKDELSVYVVGSGNGFLGRTSSFIVGKEDVYYWIDPPGDIWDFGFTSSNRLDGIIISHNHEDHIAGFPLILYQYISENKRLKVYTAESIWAVLLQQFDYSRGLIERSTEFFDISPYKGDIVLRGGVVLKTRWSHHCLPSGTLGFKFYDKKKCIGISGDTKYREDISEDLGDVAISYRWFLDTDILFHEVDKPSRHSVHTFPEDLYNLKKRLTRTRVLYYHTGFSFKNIERVQENSIY